MTSQRPRLAYFYNLKRKIMEEMLEKGPDGPASASDAWSEGWTRDVSLRTYLACVEQMIEAMATLRDFQREPFIEEEEEDLNAIWQLEMALGDAVQQ